MCMDIDWILPVFLSVTWKLADTYQTLQSQAFKAITWKHSVQMPDKGSHPVVKGPDRHLEVLELAFVIKGQSLVSRW